MAADLLTIRALEPCHADAMFAYLNDHLRDNGAGATPLFMPLSRGDSALAPDREAAFRNGLNTALDQGGWRRAWIALAANGQIAGHIDLRARAERSAAHRALLGMGVQRDYRRQGLGERLIASATAWALAHTALEWIDLEVLAVNTAAQRLYRRCGFADIGHIEDMFRIDGAKLAYLLMTRKIR